MIDFTFTEEQEMFRKAAREFAEKQIAPHADEWDQNRVRRLVAGAHAIGRVAAREARPEQYVREVVRASFVLSHLQVGPFFTRATR